MFHAFKKDLSTMFDNEPTGNGELKENVKVVKGIPLHGFPTVKEDPECL